MLKLIPTNQITKEVLGRFRERKYRPQYIYPSNLNEYTYRPPNKIQERISLSMWKAIHSLANRVLMWWDYEYIVSMYCKVYWDKFKNIWSNIVNWLNKLPKNNFENTPVELYIEKEMEKWWKLYILSAEIDCMYYEDDKLVIREIKTTSNERTDEQIEWNIQLPLYALMMYYNTRIVDIECEFIFISKDNWEVTTARFTPDLENIDKVLSDYIISLQ